MHVREKHKYYALIALNSFALFTCILLLTVLTFMPLGKNVEAQQYDIQSQQRFQQMNGLGVRAITPTPIVLPVYKSTPTPIIIASGGVPTSTPTALYSHGREPTDEEWEMLSGWFPELNRWETRVTGESTSEYNCHAWAIFKNTNDELNHEDIGDQKYPLTISEMDTFLTGYDWVPCTTENDPDRRLVVYENDVEATHTSRIYDSETGLFESKIGTSLRITHPEDGLDNSSDGEGNPNYGVRKEYYKAP